jgi:hypothetical protein
LDEHAAIHNQNETSRAMKIAGTTDPPDSIPARQSWTGFRSDGRRTDDDGHDSEGTNKKQRDPGSDPAARCRGQSGFSALNHAARYRIRGRG